MSKQINFILDQKDFDAIVKYIKTKEFILLDQFGVAVNDNLINTVIDRLWYDKNYSGENFYIADRESVLDYVVIKDKKRIEGNRSDVVEFSLRPNSEKANTFPAGRFYYVTEYWDSESESWITKEWDQTKVYNKLRYYIRKHYIIANNKFDYMGPNCYVKYLNGEDSSPNDLLYTDQEWHQLYRKK